MPGPEPGRTVEAVPQGGSGGGVLVPIARSQLQSVGVDPDEPIEVDRYVLGGDRAGFHIRMRNVDED